MRRRWQLPRKEEEDLKTEEENSSYVNEGTPASSAASSYDRRSQ